MLPVCHFTMTANLQIVPTQSANAYTIFINKFIPNFYNYNTNAVTAHI